MLRYIVALDMIYIVFAPNLRDKFEGFVIAMLTG